MKKSTILISANAEWRAIRSIFPAETCLSSPFGEYFIIHLTDWSCTFLHAGWGKIAAAASTQYAIDHFQPDLLVNLGTCGGFSGKIECGEIVLVNKSVVYDIFEQMGDFEQHIAHYSTEIDLSWLKTPFPIPVRQTLLVSGDRDLIAEDIPSLIDRYGAVAGDWESGAIAWVARRNDKKLLILRGVTDLVSNTGSDAYDDLAFYEQSAFAVLETLVRTLPAWLAAAS